MADDRIPMHEMDPDAFMAEVRRRATDDRYRVPNFAVRRLLAALDKALEHHPRGAAVGYCETCARPYPCAEVRDITRKLTGEGDDDPSD